MTGWLKVVGLGPGDPSWLTPQAAAVLAEASDLVGYGPYVDRVPHSSHQQVRHCSDNRAERQRAEQALRLAQAGHKVAVISSGDPGIFAMAAAVIEAIDDGEAAWKQIDLEIIPGLSAMQAVAARLGAPLGHDFCVISLSDILKPWSIIEKRLVAAFSADFVLAIYNPASKTRLDQIRAVFSLAADYRSGETPVMLARAVGSSQERMTIATLASVDVTLVDMRTLVLIGSSQTKLVHRAELQPLVLTPRRYEAAS